MWPMAETGVCTAPVAIHAVTRESPAVALVGLAEGRPGQGDRIEHAAV
jgi:hypothetical protein